MVQYGLLNGRRISVNETFLQILIYLFAEHYTQDVLKPQREKVLLQQLLESGFEEEESKQALAWIQGLKEAERNLQKVPGASTQSIRVYTEAEIDKLDLKSRGFISFLEKLGLIDTFERELLIDRVMALDTSFVEFEEFRCVVNIILLERNRYKKDISQLCQLVMSECGEAQ